MEITRVSQEVSSDVREILQKAKDYTRQSKAANTTRSYRADWADFTAWCQERSLSALPADPETVALYLADLADRRRTSTLQRRLAAISQAHQAAGYDSPTTGYVVRTVWAGIRRAKGTYQEGEGPDPCGGSQADSLPTSGHPDRQKGSGIAVGGVCRRLSAIGVGLHQPGRPAISSPGIGDPPASIQNRPGGERGEGGDSPGVPLGDLPG